MDKLDHLKHPPNLRLIAFGSMLLVSMGIFLFTMVVSNQQMGYKAKANECKTNCADRKYTDKDTIPDGKKQGDDYYDSTDIAGTGKKAEEYWKGKTTMQGFPDKEVINIGANTSTANNNTNTKPAAAASAANAGKGITAPTSTPVPTATPTPATGQGIFVIINNSSLGNHQIDGTQAMLTKTCSDASSSWLALGSDSTKTTDQVKIPTSFISSHPGYINLIAPNKTNASIYECIPLPN